MLPAPFDRALFERLRRERSVTLGASLTVSETTESTNDDAARSARAGAPHGAVYLAEVQTKGRGRRGHAWSSPPYENLTFSLLLRPNLPASRVSTLTLVAGAAVRAALAQRVEQPVAVKWPNDVVVDRRKLAGILVESQLSGSTVDAIVVGIGINVAMRALPESIEDVATSLALLGDASAVREAVLADVLAALEPRLDAHEQRGIVDIVAEIREHDALRGRPVRVEGVTGTAAGIGDDGALIVQRGDGTHVSVSSGTVTW